MYFSSGNAALAKTALKNVSAEGAYRWQFKKLMGELRVQIRDIFTGTEATEDMISELV